MACMMGRLPVYPSTPPMVAMTMLRDYRRARVGLLPPRPRTVVDDEIERALARSLTRLQESHP